MWKEKTRSQGQMLEKPCVRTRGHIFSPKITRFGQIICLDEISDKLKMGHFWSKIRSLGQMLEEHVCSRGHIFSSIIMKLDQHGFLDKISHKFENG